MDGRLHGAQALEPEWNPGARHERARARKGGTVGIIDSTFIESAYGGAGNAPSGYKRAVGCSVHVLIDKGSNLLSACALPANLQDAQGARILIPAARAAYPHLRLVLGDKAYRQQPLAAFAAEHGVELDGSSPALPKGQNFSPMPLRWKVERFFSWLARWRRLAKNWSFTPAGFAMDLRWALFGLQLKRFTRKNAVG